MKTKNSAILILILLFLLLSIGCLRQKSIVGKWQPTSGTETMEFFKDGTVATEGGPMALTGKYTILDEKRLKIEFGGMGALAGPMMATYEISGDELTLTAQNGSVGKYRRAD